MNKDKLLQMIQKVANVLEGRHKSLRGKSGRLDTSNNSTQNAKNEVNRSVNKDEFLQMLQEKEIRKEILRIVKDGQNYIFSAVSGKENVNDCKSEKEPAVLKSDASGDFSQEAENGIKEKNRKLENENNRLKDEIGEMQGELRYSQNKSIELSGALEEAQQKSQNLQVEVDKWNSAYQTEKRNSETLRARLQGEIDGLKQENQRLEQCKRSLEKANDSLQSQMEQRCSRLSGSLEEAKQKSQNLQAEVDKWNSAYQTEKRNSETLRARLQSEIDSLKQENQRLEQRKRSLEKANDSLQSQLEQRFSRGWELFEAYQNVSDHTKQILHNGVFTQETNFMSFICGGAQTSSLEKLWDALKECILHGQQNDAQILWDIFEYCIELVNSSKTQAKYEVFFVNEGDRFDFDIHTEGPNSLAQGKVVNVYLPGYQNTYNGKIIKKSIVQVG